jgi:Holliday junction DNA helicase RuvB
VDDKPVSDEPIFEAMEPASPVAASAAPAGAELEQRVGPVGSIIDRTGVKYQDPGDLALDLRLRPRKFEEFIGQGRVIGNLSLYVEATRRRNERSSRFVPLDHVLLTGLPGLGKTTLAHLIAHEVGAGIRATSGPAIEKAGDLAGVLTNLSAGEVLFIDEIHRLPPIVEEYLYTAMTDFAIDIMIDQGPAARSVKIDLKPFTLVGATTREGLLTAPFRSRFGVIEKLDPYPAHELQEIIVRSAGILDTQIEQAAATRLAAVSRGTPRIANRFLRRMRDVAEVRGNGRIEGAVVDEGLAMLGVDPLGLDPMDRRILTFLCQQGGQPVGLKTIAVAVGEDEGTIEDVYEPFLIQRGLMHRTPRGRRPAARAFEHVGIRQDSGRGHSFQRSLLDV